MTSAIARPPELYLVQSLRTRDLSSEGDGDDSSSFRLFSVLWGLSSGIWRGWIKWEGIGIEKLDTNLRLLIQYGSCGDDAGCCGD